MELWIRSQDRETLMIASHLDIYNLGTGTPEYYIEECGVTMGCYKDKERALEVLDEIQERIINLQLVSLEERGQARIDVYTSPYLECVYEMPKE